MNPATQYVRNDHENLVLVLIKGDTIKNKSDIIVLLVINFFIIIKYI